MADADDPTAQQLRGKRFRELHDMGTFLMANVVDAATARALGDTGVRAIATSSAAHAATLGRHDAAGKVSLEEHAEHTALICAGTELPVNVDAENGYGHEPEEVAHCIRRLAETGAVGAGIEDWSGDPDIGFYSVARATERVAAAVEAAEALDVTFTVTGRTECLLYEHPGGMDETLERLRAFASVGAHCLYAPGTWDLPTVVEVVDGAGGPVNVLALVGASAPTFEELTEVGVRRVSLGSSLANSQVAHARSLVEGILRTGRFD